MHYPQPRRRELQDVLTCIRHNVTLADAGTLLQPNDQYDLKSPAEFAALYADLPAAVARTREIAGRCTFTLDDIRYRYPSEKLPGGMTSAQWLREGFSYYVGVGNEAARADVYGAARYKLQVGDARKGVICQGTCRNAGHNASRV